jgi:hypothetical protein
MRRGWTVHFDERMGKGEVGFFFISQGLMLWCKPEETDSVAINHYQWERLCEAYVPGTLNLVELDGTKLRYAIRIRRNCEARLIIQVDRLKPDVAHSD